jgi:hypothetical protein
MTLQLDRPRSEAYVLRQVKLFSALFGIGTFRLARSKVLQKAWSGFGLSQPWGIHFVLDAV